MGFNRLREMWLSHEDTGQTYLFSSMDNQEEETEPVVRRERPPMEEVVPRPILRDRDTPPLPMESSPCLRGDTGDRLLALIDKCMELVERDPDVALNGKPVEWETWFSQPLLSSTRRANLPIGLKQRLLAFLALMVPFLEEKEQDRVQSSLSEIFSGTVNDFGEILTEQDLIQTQWLVRAVRKSRDILPQMEGLRRSIIRTIPAAPMA